MADKKVSELVIVLFIKEKRKYPATIALINAGFFTENSFFKQ